MRIERDLKLVGDDATAWMRTHGWRLLTASDDFQMSVDSARSPEFILKRLWHTATITSIELPEDCAGFKFVTFLLEGSVTLLTEHGARRVSAPSHFFIDETVEVRVSSSEPHSRLIIGLPASLYKWMPQELTIPARPYRAEALYRESMVSSALASLRGRVRRSDESFRYWTAGMESLALAAVFSATINTSDDGDALPTPEEVEAQREVLADALLFIELHGHDPQLTADRLAERMGVSRSALYRAFQSTGLTPAAHLRLARAKAEGRTGAVDDAEPSEQIFALEPMPEPAPMLRKVFV